MAVTISVTVLVQERLRQINGTLSNLAIEIRGEKLYLRGTFPPQPGDANQQTRRQRIALNLPATPKGLRAAEPIARRLSLTLIEDRAKFWSVAKPEKFMGGQTRITLSQLWERYEAFKTPQLSPNTINRDFRRYRNHLAQLPQDLARAAEIRDAILQRTSPNSARRLLVNLSACCDWAVKSGLITANPFSEFKKEIKVAKAETDINPFTREERDKILAAFRGNKFYSYYANFVEFCFLTGCRPGEAIGLDWAHVGKTQIRFCQTAYERKGTQVKAGLKTQRERLFPINDQLAALLHRHRSPSAKPTDPVFVTKTGRRIDLGDFNAHAWRGHYNRHGNFCPGIVWSLFGESGYREFYQCRHTFITACLEAGVDAKDIAAWSGNSAAVIYAHYAGRQKNKVVPTL